MKQLTEEQEITLHKGVSGKYKGDMISSIVYSLSKKYIGIRSIDIGAGTGAFLRELWKNNKNAIGIDICPKSSDVLKCRLKDIKKKSHIPIFNTAFAMDILEHISDASLESMMENTNSILKKNGYLIVTTLVDEDLESASVTCPYCGLRFHRVGHCQSFTEKRLYSLFSNHGFKIIKFQRLNLTLYSMFPRLMKLFYSLKLEKLIKKDILTKDVFIVGVKE